MDENMKELCDTCEVNLFSLLEKVEDALNGDLTDWAGDPVTFTRGEFEVLKAALMVAGGV